MAFSSNPSIAASGDAAAPRNRGETHDLRGLLLRVTAAYGAHRDLYDGDEPAVEDRLANRLGAVGHDEAKIACAGLSELAVDQQQRGILLLAIGSKRDESLGLLEG